MPYARVSITCSETDTQSRDTPDSAGVWRVDRHSRHHDRAHQTPSLTGAPLLTAHPAHRCILARDGTAFRQRGDRSPQQGLRRNPPLRRRRKPFQDGAPLCPTGSGRGAARRAFRRSPRESGAGRRGPRASPGEETTGPGETGHAVDRGRLAPGVTPNSSGALRETRPHRRRSLAGRCGGRTDALASTVRGAHLRAADIPLRRPPVAKFATFESAAPERRPPRRRVSVAGAIDAHRARRAASRRTSANPDDRRARRRPRDKPPKPH